MWYVVYVIPGKEQYFIDALQKKKEKAASFYVLDIVSPIEKVSVSKNNRKKEIVKRALPGYVFLKIHKISDELIKFLRDTNHVAGFLGGSSPSPITEEEVQAMLSSVKSKREMLDAIPEFCIGDSVSIVEGAFEGFLGIIQSVDKEKSTLGVTLSIFGRENLVSVGFMQAKKR